MKHYPGFDNISYISTNNFIIDAPLNEPNVSWPFTFIELGDVKGVSIRNNHFEHLNNVDYNDRSHGIYSIDASYQAVNNSFQSLFRGINAKNTVGTGYTVKIESNDFDDINSNVWLTGIDHAMVTKNTFKAGVNGEGYGKGLWLDNCDQYTVEENEFYKYPGSWYVYGIYVDNSGDNANMIYRNDFYDVDFGIQAAGDNDGTEDADGLHFKCNRFFNISQYNIAVSSGEVATYQGFCDFNDPTSPANNLFTNDCPTVKDFWQNTGVDWLTYTYYLSSTANTEPLCYSQSNIFLSDCQIASPFNFAEACPSNFGGGPGPGFLRQGMQTESQMASALTDSIDNGSTIALMGNISGSSLSKQSKIELLMHASPYLSDSVLSEILTNKSLAFSEAELLQVLKANSPLSEKILELVQNRQPVFSKTNMQELMELQVGVSARELLKREIAGHKAKSLNYRKQLANYFLHDTTVVDGSDSLIALYSGSTNPAIQQKAVSALIAQGEYQQAAAKINGLKQSSTTAAVLNYLEYQELLLEIMQKPSGVYVLLDDSLLVQEVESYAYSQINSKQRANARSLLTQIFGTTFPSVTEPMHSVQYREKEEGGIENQKLNLSIYPNPSDGQFTIEYQLPENTFSSKLKIYNIKGQMVFEINLQTVKEKQKQLISLTDLPSGMYFYKMEGSDVVNGKGKLVIQK